MFLLKVNRKRRNSVKCQTRNLPAQGQLVWELRLTTSPLPSYMGEGWGHVALCKDINDITEERTTLLHKFKFLLFGHKLDAGLLIHEARCSRYRQRQSFVNPDKQLFFLSVHQSSLQGSNLAPAHHQEPPFG